MTAKTKATITCPKCGFALDVMNPRGWMDYFHIPEHMEAGMMGELTDGVAT